MRVLICLLAVAVLSGADPQVATAGQSSSGGDDNTTERYWQGSGSEPVSVTIRVNGLNTSRLTDVDPATLTITPQYRAPGDDGLLPSGGDNGVCTAGCDTQTTSVPEPATMLLLSGALVALAVRRRRV